MGLCRVLVDLTAASRVARDAPARGRGGALLCYLIGLTYVAKQEHLGRIGSLWPLGFLAAPSSTASAGAARTAVWLPLLSAWASSVALACCAGGAGDVPRAVVMIAGIALVDGVLLAGADSGGAGRRRGVRADAGAAAMGEGT